jgi:hypothetical protein
LAEQRRALVCGMNLDVLEGTAAKHLRARLEPLPGRCCVTVCACDTAATAKENSAKSGAVASSARSHGSVGTLLQ